MWQRVLPEAEILSLASYRCIKSAGDVIAWTDFENLPTDEVKKEHIFCSGNFCKHVLLFLLRLYTVNQKILKSGCLTYREI